MNYYPLCPSCEQELTYDDYFGEYRHPVFIKRGDIFCCYNYDCDCYEESFYMYSADGVLLEGYPC